MTDRIVRLRLVTHNARLVDARKEFSLTALAFAELIEMARSRLCEIENLRKNPTEDEICEMATLLRKTPDYLFPESLLRAVKTGVFDKRIVELESPQLDRLAESRLPPLLTDGGIEEVEAKVDIELLRGELNKVVTKLKGQQAFVIKKRYGLDNEECCTLSEVARQLGVTRQRVQQIEDKALQRLRYPTRRRRLRRFLEA